MTPFLLIALLAIISAAQGWNVFGEWALVTSKDVTQNAPPRVVFSTIGDYYVYAVFSGSAADKNYYQNVYVQDDKGKSITVFSLGASRGQYFTQLYQKFSGSSQIMVLDRNNGTTPALPYVVYVVKSALFEKTNQPIYDASYINGKSINNYATLVSATLTILSAEPHFTLSDFDMGSGAILEVFTGAYDSTFSEEYRVFHVTQKQYASRSRCTIIGPIATVAMTRLANVHFALSISTNQPIFNTTIEPGSVYTITTPGYATMNSAYAHPWNSALIFPQVQEVTYSYDTSLTVSTKGSFNPGHMRLEVVGSLIDNQNFNSMNQQFDQEYKHKTKVRTSLQSTQVPNYYLEITSGASLIGSIVTLIVAFGLKSMA